MSEFKNFDVLFVEDDFQIQKNMAKILNLIFNKVYIASNGLEALDFFDKNSVNIIIVDYEMPIMDGYEFIRVVREKNSDIPIIILSNYTDKDKLIKCIPLNLVSYLEKPIIYEDLMKVLKNCISKIELSSNFNYKISENLKYNSKIKSIVKDENIVKLTAFEADFLEVLLLNKNQVVDKNILIELLTKDDYIDEISLKNVVYRLKKKLTPKTIINHKNIGYMLVCS